MLVDEAEVTIKGGHGGPGKVSFYKPPMKGPDGGNGGSGGDAYIKATSDLSVLNKYTTIRIISAEDGDAGGSNRKFGKVGKDLEILIPEGALFTDVNSGEQFELVKSQRLLICKGGKGGKGNYEFKSPSNTTPKYAQKGLPGEEKRFKIVLRFIADVGLIGLPNAGKSSLLNELTNSQAKIADYPFTTLEPNLGVLFRHPGDERSESIGSSGKDSIATPSASLQNDNIVIADIPGLIEGASTGKGLGTKFLKHIEKVNLLLHCISSESEDLKKDYLVIRNELKQHNPELLKKKEIILVTKSDLVSRDELKQKTDQLKGLKKKIYTVSVHDWDSLETLKKLLVK